MEARSASRAAPLPCGRSLGPRLDPPGLGRGYGVQNHSGTSHESVSWSDPFGFSLPKPSGISENSCEFLMS